jgi:hypothetical protein
MASSPQRAQLLPEREPPLCRPSDHKTWAQDSQALSTALGHPGVRKWRSSTGDECIYSNVILNLGEETYNYGADNTTLQHIVMDFLAHWVYAGDLGYEPGLTTSVSCETSCSQ